MKPHSKSILALAVFSLVAAAFVTPSSRPAQAAGTWYVAPPATGSDSNDCLTPSTPCATINGAIAKAAPGDTIKVAVGTYTGSGSEVVLVDKSITLSGGWDAAFTAQSGNTIIDGQITRRGLAVTSNVLVSVEYFDVQYSRYSGDFIAYNGAGVSNAGNLSINNSRIRFNAYASGVGGSGVYNSGIMTITNSLVTDNSDLSYGFGAAVVNQAGTLVINNSTISDDYMAIQNYGGNINVSFSNIVNNPAYAVENGEGNLVISNSLISAEGSGILNGPSASLTLSNSTVTGVISGSAINNSGMASINSSTIAGNRGAYGALNNDSSSSPMYLRNSIVGDNTDSTAPDCRGGITSLGYNLIGNTSGCIITSTIGDILNTAPGLRPLQNNGGPTNSFALWPNSPAINAGDPQGCLGTSGYLTIDQRGAPRTGRCDIGAYEANVEVIKGVRGVFKPGGLITYTVTLANFAGGTQSGAVALTDTLPALVSYWDGSLTTNMGSATQNNGVITWTGSIPNNSTAIVEFAATVSESATLQSITNTAFISWSGLTWSTSAAFDTSPQVYLPLTLNSYCPAFFDDFSNPSSGWPVGEDDLVRFEYLGGEYRILSKNGDYFYAFRAPACPRQNYVLETDARWVGTPGGSYGLVFDVTSGFSHYYLFALNTDYQMFRLYLFDSFGSAPIIPWTYSSAIRSGVSSNHLKVTRSGIQITLSVNGATLGTWYDSSPTGPTWVGLMSSPYSDLPVSDARFDNFLVATLQATGAGVTAGEQDGMTTQGNSAGQTTPPAMVPSELERRLPEKGILQENK